MKSFATHLKGLNRAEAVEVIYLVGRKLTEPTVISDGVNGNFNGILSAGDGKADSVAYAIIADIEEAHGVSIEMLLPKVRSELVVKLNEYIRKLTSHNSDIRAQATKALSELESLQL